MTGYDLIGRMRKTRRRYPLNATEQALYNELVAICNEEQWPELFSCSNDELCAALRVSENTLDKARCVLIQAGLIFYKSGKSKRQFGQYSFSNKVTTAKIAANVYTYPGTNVGTNPETNDETNPPENPADYIKPKRETLTKQNIEVGADAPAAPQGKGKKIEVKKFQAPELAEVFTFFMSTIGNSKNQKCWPEDKCRNEAGKCFDHYAANGWVQGRGKPIKNWQAACRNWIRNALEGSFGNPAQRPSAAPSAAAPVNLQPQKPKLEPIAIEINFLYGRFCEGFVTIKSLEHYQYDYLKKVGLINFSEPQVDAIKKQAIRENAECSTNQATLTRYMKLFGVIAYFTQLKAQGKEAVFEE